MLLRIIKTDVRSLIADKTLPAIAILFAAVIAYGTYNGASWVKFQRETIAAAEREEGERFDRLKTQIADIERGSLAPAPWLDPRVPSRVGGGLGARYAMLPPAPLSSLSVGQSDLYPYYFQVTTRSRQTFLNNDEVENPTNLLAGKFDSAFVVIYLYPLLILALSYNVLSSEKEAGTLQMTLAQPVSLRKLLMGKIVARASIIVALTVAFAVAGLLVSGETLENGGLFRLGLWTIVIAAYGAFWFALAVAINGLGRSSATNALALTGMWLLIVMIIPSLVSVASTALYPVPSRVEMVQATRSASKSASTRGSQLLAKYLEDHPELAPAGGANMEDFALRSIAVQEEVEHEIQPVIARFDDQLLRRQKLLTRFRFLSPALIAQVALNDISGTGIERYRHFLSLVDRHHAAWVDHFNPKIFQRETLKGPDYERIPRFEFHEESNRVVAGRAMIGWAGLLALVGVASISAIAVLRRYSPVM
jgi:ABC-2 type transport system permease protein